MNPTTAAILQFFGTVYLGMIALAILAAIGATIFAVIKPIINLIRRSLP